MKIIPLILGLMALTAVGFCQQNNQLFVSVVKDDNLPAAYTSLQLFKESEFVKAALTDTTGNTVFTGLLPGNYRLQVSQSGFGAVDTLLKNFPANGKITIRLYPNTTLLDQVSVRAKKAFVEYANGKTIINVESAITNIGTTVLEVLEKSPGVMVDKNGGIALQGKAGVLILIDDKPTYLSGADLNNLLSSMSSSQLSQIELMPNPSAKYDASGNAGIINLKTKKTKAKGFNTTLSLSGTQGVYPKTNNSIVLNFRDNKFNYFLNYSVNSTEYYTEIYAYRKYFNVDNDITAILDQPTNLKGKFTNHTIRTGIDYTLTPKTTVGFALGATHLNRKNTGEATAIWLSSTGSIDSSILTLSSGNNFYRNKTINGNIRHSINKRQNLSVDVDRLKYEITADQEFNNRMIGAGSSGQASRAHVPNRIEITVLKSDYSYQANEKLLLLAGLKSSRINTDNLSSYQNLEGGTWKEDFGKSNHFIYKENINAGYVSLENTGKKLSWQAGLRYEFTKYDANQLGNIQQKDSSFNRKYSGLFPSGYLSYRVDSFSNLTLTISRRIDRPGFQVLNPFTIIINKYTYQTGNPYIIPQYSNNAELGYQYKKWLSSSLSYSLVENYFSQIFLNDTIAGLLYYSQGNVGQTSNLGASLTLMMSPAKWWSFTLHTVYNHKELKGFKQDANFESDIDQLSSNINNQFSFGKIYTGEISGIFTSRARNDLQELLYPISQFSIALSRPILKKKGTIKIGVRDIFHNKAMEGFTTFPQATEYFYLKRDSRVFTCAFTYRFGKAYKTNRKAADSSGDEMQRVG